MYDPQKLCMMCMILSPNCCAVTIFEYSSTDVTLLPILGDPGASSWDNALFLGESLFQELKIRLVNYS